MDFYFDSRSILLGNKASIFQDFACVSLHTVFPHKCKRKFQDPKKKNQTKITKQNKQKSKTKNQTTLPSA